MNVLLKKFVFPDELSTVIANSPSVIIPDSKEKLYELIFGNEHSNEIEVLYEVGDKIIKEVDVVRCRNGAVVNYTEDYMRRRDADLSLIHI